MIQFGRWLSARLHPIWKYEEAPFFVNKSRILVQCKSSIVLSLFYVKSIQGQPFMDGWLIDIREDSSLTVESHREHAFMVQLNGQSN
jgi:hypothetical protein